MTDTRNHLSAYAVFLVLAGAYLVMAFWFPIAYLWATYEDLAGEWLQFWLFVIALVFFFRLALGKSRFRLFFAFLSLCCFYVAMEEISWGQRLLDLPTPDFFREHNIQKETNLHNLFTGPVATATKQWIEYGLAGGLVGYGLIYPLALRWRVNAARCLMSLGLAPPPLFLWPFFVVSGVLELGLIRFNEAEVAEVFIALAMAAMAVYYTVARRMDGGLRKIADLRGDYPVDLARGMALLLITAAMLAGATTVYSFAAPGNRERIENRILNGVEKFAGRYKRFEQLDTAAALYLHVHQAEPGRNSILRKLADCHRLLGDDAQFRRYNELALQNDLARLPQKGDSISLHQSLTRTYRQRGDDAMAAEHLQQALDLAMTRVAQKPDSASAAYWLGRTYKLMGEHGKALAQYQNACRLSPTSIKYQKAYLRLKNSSSHDEG